MNSSKPDPIYLLSPDNDMLDKYADMIMLSVANDMPPLTITVQPEMVRTHDATEPHNIVLSLQHYPDYIEEMLFTIDFRFASVAGGDLYMNELDWKSNPAIAAWLRNVGTLPMTLFFVRDRDVRFLMLAGDFLTENLFPIVDKNERRGKVKIAVQGAQLDTLCERFAGCCYMMMLYCHGSGFDPKPVIETLMADFDLPVNYDVIHEQYIEDVNNHDMMNQRMARVLHDYFELKEGK